MKHFIFLFVVLSISTKTLGDEFTTDQKIAIGAVETLYVLDWIQTRQIASNPGYRELNPLLGEHPSNTSINTHTIAAMVITPTIAYFLPKKYKSWFLWTQVGVETLVVGRNYHIGLKFNF